MKFKGSGRFQNVTLLGDDHVLNVFYLGTSSSRSDDVEWFTGKGFVNNKPVFDRKMTLIDCVSHFSTVVQGDYAHASQHT